MTLKQSLDNLLDAAMEDGDLKLCWYVSLLVDRQSKLSKPDWDMSSEFAENILTDLVKR